MLQRILLFLLPVYNRLNACIWRWHRKWFLCVSSRLLENILEYSEASIKFCLPQRKWHSHCFPSIGCFDPSTKTIPSLFYCDTRCGSDTEVYHAPFQAQRLMVLSSVDVIYVLDLTPHPRWHSSWLVDLPIWKNFSFAILALCSNHIIFTSHLLIGYVFNRDQTNDVFKTWNSYWCLK